MSEKINEIEFYTGIRRAHQPSWSPDGSRLAFIADISGLDQAWLLNITNGSMEQLTHFNERVGRVEWSPDGQHLLITVDAGGNEHFQLYLLSLSGDEPRPLTQQARVIHHFGAWSPDSQSICYSSNQRHPAFFDIWVLNISSGESRCVLALDASLDVLAWSPDGKNLVVSRANTSLDNDLFLLPLDGGSPRLLTFHEHEAGYSHPRFSSDSCILYVLTNYATEFTTPAALDLTMNVASNEHIPIRRLSSSCWGADDGLALSPDGRLLAWGVNEDGSSRLVFYDVEQDKLLPSPELPAGVISDLAWAPDSAQVAFSFNGALYNGNIWTAAPGADAARQLTHLSMNDLDRASLIEPSLVHFPSFDGLEIPAFYYRPISVERVRNGKLPVIIFVHGGPESQFRPQFASSSVPPLQYYLHQGFAVLAPNVRGSSGYGKTYIHLDDVRLRPNSVADLKAAVTWLIDQGDADPQRIGIMGRSYGGFMVLAAITSYPDLWAAAADIVGIANFLSFFENTGVWRRHLRASEYGDPERDADFLRELSPLFKADRITSPLLVLHGANDPRVPVSEAEQIVQAVSSRGHPTRLLIFPDEGHFMLRKSTQLTAYAAIGEWFESYMG